MRRIGRFVLRSLAVIGFLTLTLAGLGLWAVIHADGAGGRALPRQMILALDLEAPIHEGSPQDPLARLGGDPGYELLPLVQAIDRAATDDRVKALFAVAGQSSLGLAQIQEIGDAVARFRASGKPAILFAESLGEGANASKDVVLAAQFSQIWLQPSGEVGLAGLLAESPFLRGTLDLLGIEAQFGGRKEYKSAIETFTETRYSAANAQALNAILDSYADQMITAIARGRNLPVDKVRALFGQGPFLAHEALGAGLVDQLGYRDQALDAANGTGPRLEQVDLADYAQHLPEGQGVPIALITGSGAIQRGQSDHGFGSEEGFGSDRIAGALRDAADAPDIRAILFRVDSPGGSYVASDTIRHEVLRAREMGKKVVVSMGNTAASGGYFVSMGADRIIAQPGTLTGSIGVFSGKVVLADFWKKLGVSWDSLSRGDNAALWSSNQKFDDKGWQRLNAILDHIYADFTGKAAKDRGLPLARLEQAAKGRVWTGQQAQAAGLVDKLGGMDVAQAEIRALLALPADQELDLIAFPEPLSAWEQLTQIINSGAQTQAGLKVLARAGQVMAPLVQAAQPRALLSSPIEAPR